MREQRREGPLAICCEALHQSLQSG
jgi:hypothetical protein